MSINDARLKRFGNSKNAAAGMIVEDIMEIVAELLLYRATGRSPEEIKAMDVVVVEVEESRDHSAQGKHALVGPYGCPVCRALAALQPKEPKEPEDDMTDEEAELLYGENKYGDHND